MKVLIVDDIGCIRYSVAQLVARQGNTPLSAPSGFAALKLLHDHPEIAVVISDLMMPEMTGLELFKQVKTEYPHVLRIILTGYADFEIVKAAINEAEIYRFLTKPWDDDDLRLTLRNAVHRLSLERDNHQLKITVRRHEDRLRELEVLQRSLFYYYDETVMAPGSTQTKKVEPFTDSWRADTFKRLVIVAVLETYLPVDGQKFLGEIERELDATTPKL